jgi:hypothetical protein
MWAPSTFMNFYRFWGAKTQVPLEFYGYCNYLYGLTIAVLVAYCTLDLVKEQVFQFFKFSVAGSLSDNLQCVFKAWNFS